ncbi:hypothetical protein A3G55_04500 [Candidatus Giovannonibacteria bacterium RIFCSPLOWO2_12_FULL_44_25]|uniref:Uncharacterized protein n=2 Tax=Candidatus Giovannoniibacteriota TaxID=1752738 RepID=A0A1F5WA56_9BACT|nr:MAG: hypothetical protein UW15_C0006G0012 [Parcubacteria group bacterium GW2011_GWC1_44_10]KKT59885.1 MAG: hypothetical protein UW53_C0006G0032 [Candidatus Giovannonibacteria bacterium GW2011_GWA1_44_25]KKU29871.1 MAG: hypothetical protein UX43_C0004G0032 [Candidatus Giovannonibacteria bacterium GW2011_GWB1_46_20]OGF48935.1 MAG: hypothetical protein A2120_05020 [Candidatus Giovannonibacteria bacterium GWA2_45_15]OGF59711.1 MAG: hypothetical protein A2W40_01335 [Candidatus Giovannonibacteria 
MKPETQNIKLKTRNLKLKCSKFYVTCSMILLLGLVLSFAIAPLALAVSTPTGVKTSFDNSIEQKGTGLIGYLGTGFLWGFNGLVVALGKTVAGLVDLTAMVFDGALEFSLSTLKQQSIIASGWTISRDVANIFFILILLTIAIATILRSASYGAKSLLPKLIVVALLINFSLTIGYVIIDASNVLGLQFYRAMTTNGSPGPTSIASAIVAGTKLQNVWNMEPPKSSVVAEISQVGRGLAVGAGAAVGIAACLIIPGCGWVAFFTLLATGGGVGAVGWAAVTGSDVGSATEFFYLSMGSLIFMIAVLFVLVAGAIFLIMRAVMLTLLLVLAPIAFISYALPVTEKKLWQSWWETFINQAFFLPAFMFLLYISIGFINQFGKDVPEGNILLNPPAILLIMTATLMLLTSFLLARKMGILFADSVIKGATTARKWLTGAVGGLAARYTTGLLGTAIAPAAAKLQERVPLLGTAPTRFSGWLKGLGGTEARAGAMADFAKQLTPERQAKYFAGLGAQEKVALLSKLNPEQQAEMMKFMSSEDRATAEGIIKRQLPPTAAARFDLESWKRLSSPEQIAQFGNYSPEAQAQILRSFPDDEKRAEFVLNKLSGAAQASAKNILASPAFITAEQLSYNKAEKRQEMRNAELKGGTAFEDFINSKDPGEQKRYFKAAEDRQRVLWLEKMHTNATALGRYQNSVKSELNPEEQAKFNSEVLRRVSTPAVTSYVDALPQTEAEKVVVTLSADQQAALYIRWAKDKPRLSVVEKATGALSADQKKNFYTSLAQQTGQKNIAEVADIYLDLPPETQSIVWQRNPTKMVSVVEYVKGANPDAHARMASVALKQGGLKRETIKAIITPEIIKHPEMVETIISSGSMGSIEAITGGDKAKIKALQDAVSNSIAQTTKDAGKIPNVKAKIRTSKPFQDLKAASGGMISDEDAFEEVLKTEKDFRAEALAEMMEEKNNRLMAKQIRDTLAGIASAAHQEILNRLLGT